LFNDALADSRDVSWLWDVDVSELKNRPSISTSGTRAYDIANRLKYADISVENVSIDVEKALSEFIKHNDSGVIFLTYTAMLSVRKQIHKMHKGDPKP
jgi:UDP-N-acetylmuramyl tripeptide synthase